MSNKVLTDTIEIVQLIKVDDKLILRNHSNNCDIDLPIKFEITNYSIFTLPNRKFLIFVEMKKAVNSMASMFMIYDLKTNNITILKSDIYLWFINPHPALNGVFYSYTASDDFILYVKENKLEVCKLRELKALDKYFYSISGIIPSNSIEIIYIKLKNHNIIRFNMSNNEIFEIQTNDNINANAIEFVNDNIIISYRDGIYLYNYIDKTNIKCNVRTILDKVIYYSNGILYIKSNKYCVTINNKDYTLSEYDSNKEILAFDNYATITYDQHLYINDVKTNITSRNIAFISDLAHGSYITQVSQCVDIIPNIQKIIKEYIR